MWPVMVFFTSSTLHMLAHGAWAEVMMIAGAAELGLASGKLRSPLWRLAIVNAFVVTGIAFLDPRAERLVLPALRVPAPPARLDVPRFRDLPARPRDPPALGGVRERVRARVRRGRRDRPVLRPRRRARLRPPVAARRESRTDEAARSRRASSSHWIWPAAAFAHATLKSRAARVPRSGSRPLRRGSFSASTRASTRWPTRSSSTTRRARSSPGAARNGTATRARVRPPPTGCRAAPTPSAGTRSRATRTSSPASTPSASA